MSGEKTEKATPKKLRELRKKGTVARSIELPQAVALLATVALLPSALGRLASSVQASMVTALSSPPKDYTAAVATTSSLVSGAVSALAPMLAALSVLGLLASVLVSRSAPNPSALKPRKERVSPRSGVKRLFSTQVLFELTRHIVKLTLVALVSWSAWQAGYAALVAGPGSVDSLVSILRHSLGTMLLRIALLAVLVGVVDAAWSRRKFNKTAKMSKHDIREEGKQSEGNPEVKGQIRARQAKLSRSRMLAAIATADVVLANPTHLVVALKYTAGTNAPVVVAKAAGGAADRIKAEAAVHGVPVIADKPLARAIYRAAEVGDPIPAELYRAVAEILATVYSTRRRRA